MLSTNSARLWPWDRFRQTGDRPRSTWLVNREVIKGDSINVRASDVIVLAHAGFGVLGILSAVWVFVEALNAHPRNSARIRAAAWVVPLCMAGAGLLGGDWYLHAYPADKALILGGPWPFAHSLFMETKEHLFLLVMILSLYLPIAASEKLHANATARKLVLWVALLIALNGLTIEGFGAVVNHGAKIALSSTIGKGTP
jgi:hypothetical protein